MERAWVTVRYVSVSRLQLPHIVLVGLPGAGKSTAGAMAAARLASDFLDFDVEIETRTGLTVSRIFADQGEGAFRELEFGLTRELLAAPAMVVAPGGGWMANSANTALLRQRARIIHLLVGVDSAISRLGDRAGSRPLLAGDDPADSLSRLWAARKPFYRRADAEVDTDVIDLEGVVRAITKLATDWGWHLG